MENKTIEEKAKDKDQILLTHFDSVLIKRYHDVTRRVKLSMQDYADQQVNKRTKDVEGLIKAEIAQVRIDLLNSSGESDDMFLTELNVLHKILTQIENLKK